MSARSSTLRIAITADPELPVPPTLYGGIERVIDLLVRGLVARGHEVSLFAHRDSSTPARFIPYAGCSSRSWRDTVRNMGSIAAHLHGRRFDILHSFSRLAYLLPLLPSRLPKLMTYQRPITRRSVLLAHRLARGTLQFSAVSRSLMAGVNDVGIWHAVYNGVDMRSYQFVSKRDANAPLMFLGRIEHVKGTHLAIEIARKTGVPLIIAGNVEPNHRDYFCHNIQPYIDGNSITFVGPVNDRDKNALLGKARALLMPLLWDEPFGIVMAEALACGTPVIALDRGSTSEVVDSGVSGFVCRDVDEMEKAVGRLDEIDPASCRLRAERLFSGDAVVNGYLAVYEKIRGTVDGLSA